MAQTIVFSFLQKKNHPELESFLIPTIAMSKTQVAICLYDSQYDIFLETPCLDLLNGTFLNEVTVVVFWLALNYRYCCSGVPDEIIKTDFKADFFKCVGPLLDKYYADVQSPCDYQTVYTWPSVSFGVSAEKTVNNVNQTP